MIEQINDIKTVQRKGLRILLEVDAICKTNGITYFLEGGTLLGAVRHQGFIPWDDDIDITMLREDYELFINKAKEELPSRYFLQTTFDDPHFPFGFAKIIDTKSRFPNNKNKFKTGFCIDVLPIDNAHDNKIIHNLNIFIIKVIQGLSKSKIVLDMSNYNSTIIKITVKIASITGKLFSTRFLMEMQRKIATMNNYKKTKNKCIYSYQFNYLNRLFPREIYEDVEMLNFEGYNLPAPKGWDKSLRILYGDYMTLPPIEKRVPLHGFEKIQFIED